MKNILILGAGRSATSLINYLADVVKEEGWGLKVGDYSKTLADEKCKNFAHIETLQFDVNDEEQCNQEVSMADLVISMLPASFHPVVAEKTDDDQRNHLLIGP